MGLAEKQGQTVESAAATPVDIDFTGKHKSGRQESSGVLRSGVAMYE